MSLVLILTQAGSLRRVVISAVMFTMVICTFATVYSILINSPSFYLFINYIIAFLVELWICRMKSFRSFFSVSEWTACSMILISAQEILASVEMYLFLWLHFQVIGCIVVVRLRRKNCFSEFTHNVYKMDYEAKMLNLIYLIKVICELV